MDNEEDELCRPSTSRGDEKPSECPKESSRLNNNVINGYDASKCCMDCDTAAQQDHMIAASLVYCDQEDNDSDDDCCIYTYKGDRQEPVVDDFPVDNRNVSPLMDYLEMDFDPEPNIGIESEDEEIIVPDGINNYNEPEISPEEPIPSSSGVNVPSYEQEFKTFIKNIGIIKTNKPILKMPIKELCSSSTEHNGLKDERNGCVRRNTENLEICHKMKRIRVDEVSWVKEMIWSESDAAQLQISQIGKSACGATSVLNTLLALRIPFNIDHIIKTIGTRLRDETASLIPYLESRAVAGCMAQDMVRTLETATDSLVTARFFATDQNLESSIAPWLANWIKKGAVPILTLNCQRKQDISNSLVPDSWHHQMMYGVTYNPLRPECAQIYLTNPLSQYSLEVLHPQLFSPSELMIRRDDVLSRWTLQTDLMPLVTHSCQNWHRLNVLGQVAHILRERQAEIEFTKHIVIPANYKSGITLAIRTSSNYSHELKSVPEL